MTDPGIGVRAQAVVHVHHGEIGDARLARVLVDLGQHVKKSR